MFDNEADIVCADMPDNDNAVNSGFVTLGNNDDELVFPRGSSYNEALAFCLQGDPNVP